MWRSKAGRRGKHEVQICSIDETCQSNSLHRISTLSFSYLPEVGDESLTAAASPSKVRWAFSSAFMIGVPLMNWVNCGVSNTMSLNKVVSKHSSRGASMWATTTSKYSLSPLNKKYPRLGRTERVGGGGCWCSGSGRD